MKRRFNVPINDKSSVTSFDLEKDLDLIINLGFDFKKGTYFEYLGFMEKISLEENALTKRMSYRVYKKVNPSKNGKKEERERHMSMLGLRNKYFIRKEKDNELGEFEKITGK